MITALITLICCLIALALFAGAFYLAQYVVSLKHRVNVLEDSYAQATEHIQKQEEVILQMQQEIDYTKREVQHNSQRSDRPRAWNPADPLNSIAR